LSLVYYWPGPYWRLEDGNMVATWYQMFSGAVAVWYELSKWNSAARRVRKPITTAREYDRCCRSNAATHVPCWKVNSIGFVEYLGTGG